MGLMSFTNMYFVPIQPPPAAVISILPILLIL
jgi:hypothetical protein